MNRALTSRLGPWIVALLSAAALFRQTAHYGLMGHDTYPLIVTTRIASFGDLLSNLTERLMDGRYPGAFYRPLAGLTIALDHALWGLAPVGYQWTGVLVFTLCVVALGGLAWRLAGRPSWVAPLVTTLVFALHPKLFEVLPVPSRRAEMLCCLFMALAISAQLAPRRLAAARSTMWPAVFTLLAVASKETAFLLPALVFVAVLVHSPRPGWIGRVGHAVSSTVPHLGVVLAMLAVRWAVIGGIGGHTSTSLSQLAPNLPHAFMAIAGGVALPVASMLEPAGRGLASGVLLFAAAALLTRAWSRGGGVPPDLADARAGRAATVALAWISLVILVQAVAGLASSWHLFIPVAGWALLAGTAVEYFVRIVRDGRGAAVRGTAAAACAFLVALLLWQARFSPIVFHYDEWERATAASEDFQSRTVRAIGQTANGNEVQAPPLPYWVATKPGRAGVDGAAILADYSVQAWVELVLPQRKVRVLYGDRGGGPPAADEVCLRITGFREDL